MDMKTCTAGFSRLDITPPLGVRLGGYYTIREASGVLDPLFVNAVAFGQGDKAAVLLVCDLLGIYNNAAFLWPAQIAQQLGLPEDAVFMCHTHTHTGPVVASSLMGGREPSDPQYDEWLFRRLCNAARLALDDLTPVTDVLSAEGLAPGFAFVRRVLMKDGHYQTWASLRDPQIERFACDGDDSMRVIRILRQDAKDLILVNFQLHPDTIGGCLYSADYPGALRRRVEQTVPDCFCIYLDGAEGQLIDCDYVNGFCPETYEDAMNIGSRLGEEAAKLLDSATSTGVSGLSFARSLVRAKTKRDPSRLPEADRLIALHKAGRDDDVGPRWMSTPLFAEAYVLRRLEDENLDYIDLRVSSIAFCGMALLGLPGEPFCEIGKHIRTNSPYPVTCVCCQTNGCEGYYPVAEAYDQGGYEPRNTRFIKGVAEQLMEGSDALLSTLFHH